MKNIFNFFKKSKTSHALPAKYTEGMIYSGSYLTTTSSYYNVVKEIYDHYFKDNSIKSRIIKTIIDYRSSWICNREIDITSTDSDTNEFIQNLIKENDFISLLIYGSILSEIQGNILFEIVKVKDESNKYKFVLKILDYVNHLYDFNYEDGKIKEFYIYHKDNMSIENKKLKRILKDDSFFYICTYGTPELIKEKYPSGLPNVAYVLKDIDDIVNIKKDIRDILNIFSNPIPVFHAEDDFKRNIMREAIVKDSWKIGHSLFLTKEENFDYKQANLNGIDSLQKEKVVIYQEISGYTGIPIFLLGFPELIGGGRATAQEFAEAVNVATAQQKILLQEQIKKLFIHLVKLNNYFNNESLNYENIIVKIPETSLSLIKAKIELINTMYDRGLISKETYLNLNPLIENTAEELIKIQNDKTEEISIEDFIKEDM